MWNFITGFFLGRSSDSDEGTGCGGIIGGVVGLFVLFYLIKWTVAADAFMTRAVDNRNILAMVFYPYLIQKFHHLTVSSALWASFLCMMLAAILIGTIHVIQEQKFPESSFLTKIVFSILRLYFYVLIAYQAINGGKVLWHSSLIKALGWYLLGFAIICFIRGLSTGTKSSSSPQKAEVGSGTTTGKPVDYKDVNQHLNSQGIYQTGPERLIIHGETLSNDANNTLDLPLLGATLIQRMDINDGRLTVCSMEPGKSFQQAGIRTGYILNGITIINRSDMPILRTLDLATTERLYKSFRVGDRLVVAMTTGAGTENENDATFEVNIVSHIRAVN